MKRGTFIYFTKKLAQHERTQQQITNAELRFIRPRGENGLLLQTQDSNPQINVD